MNKAGVECGFAKDVKIDVCGFDFLCSGNTGVKEFRIHERAIRESRRIFCCNSFVCCGFNADLCSARAKAAMQIANVRDFDIDAVHDSPLNSIIASWYSLSLPAFLIFLNIFLGVLGSRYSQNL